MTVSARGVDKQVYRKFKAKSVEMGLKTGTAMTLAMKEWVGKKEKKKKKVESFFDKLKPWDWGKGSENSSLEIDEVIYGLKK